MVLSTYLTISLVHFIEEDVAAPAEPEEGEEKAEGAEGEEENKEGGEEGEEVDPMSREETKVTHSL
jgi:hypothetical protein